MSVDPGICGMKARIIVEKRNVSVNVNIESKCSDVKAFSSNLKSLSINEVLKPLSENRIYREAAKFLRHPSCPIPCAVLKAIEVELGLALKKDVHLTFCS
ncbi:MAG: hypothetical protein DRJ60_04975 [Thermoprotei archaeon]|nr:MAG: hypothetical protein DRJ60_04975 [Thermoprotei archaeon]